ncbi:MAG: agmatine deiminase family protein [Candidatus Methylacidiphilales bacterium]
MNVIDPDQFDLSGYRMPAEWEPHEATWLAWPSNAETWPETLPEVQTVWIQMAEHLSRGEHVHFLANNPRDADDIRHRLRASSAVQENVSVHVIPNNDAWMRDSGPIFLVARDRREPSLLANDFVFNSWGKKYGPWEDDDIIPRRLAAMIGCPVIAHDLVLEGGSIDVNGQGLLLTTRQCLLNPNRNPHLSQNEIEARLKTYLGVSSIIWLGDGIEGDDTDGHIDDIARFVGPNTIVTVVEKDSKDPNFEPLQMNLQILREARNLDGVPFEIIELPMPERREGPFGRSPASYANFYIGNAVVLVPIYSSPQDAVALDRLRPCFPGREVIGIECTPVAAGLGAIHCVTQQQPALPAV